MRKILILFLVMCLMCFSLSGCKKKKEKEQENNDELSPVSALAVDGQEAENLQNSVPLYLYFPNRDNSGLVLEIRYISMNEAKSTDNLATAIVNEIIKGPGDDNLLSSIPKGAKLEGVVTVDKGNATVDFNKAFVDNHQGGAEQEKMTIFSIVNSLTELKEVEKVVFKINGKQQEEYKGSFKFDLPFPRSPSLIIKSSDNNKNDTATQSYFDSVG